MNIDVPAGVGAPPLDTQLYHSIFLANILFSITTTINIFYTVFTYKQREIEV